MGFNVAQQLILVLAHSEEIILFLDHFGLGQMVWALTVNQLFIRVKTLAAETVKTAITIEINISGLIYSAEHFLHVADVIVISGADKMIVRKSAFIPYGAKSRADFVSKRLRLESRAGCRLGNFVTMLVGAGEVKSFGSLGAVISRQGIRKNHCIGVAQMRFRVDIIERRRDVDSVHQGLSTARSNRSSSTIRRLTFL